MAKVFPKRYAQAVFEIARETNEIEKWRADLKVLADLGRDSNFVTAMESPKVRFEDKIKLVDELLKGVSQMARNLAYLLISRNKAGIIGSVSEQYERLLDEYYGIKHAEVTTAVPIEEDEKNKVAAALEAVTGNKIVMTIRVDPSIIGGMVARIDGKLLDGSTAGKLIALKKELVGAGK